MKSPWKTTFDEKTSDPEFDSLNQELDILLREGSKKFKTIYELSSQDSIDEFEGKVFQLLSELSIEEKDILYRRFLERIYNETNAATILHWDVFKPEFDKGFQGIRDTVGFKVDPTLAIPGVNNGMANLITVQKLIDHPVLILFSLAIRNEFPAEVETIMHEILHTFQYNDSFLEFTGFGDTHTFWEFVRVFSESYALSMVDSSAPRTLVMVIMILLLYKNLLTSAFDRVPKKTLNYESIAWTYSKYRYSFSNYYTTLFEAGEDPVEEESTVLAGSNSYFFTNPFYSLVGKGRLFTQMQAEAILSYAHILEALGYSSAEISAIISTNKLDCEIVNEEYVYPNIDVLIDEKLKEMGKSREDISEIVRIHSLRFMIEQIKVRSIAQDFILDLCKKKIAIPEF